MILQIKAKHYKNAEYSSPWRCPISKAATEYFKLENGTEAWEGVFILSLVNVNITASEGEKYKTFKQFTHATYHPTQFDQDLEKSLDLSPEQVVREIELTEINLVES